MGFNKGDVITITQAEEGGWWEGTLGEKTGWFPSNYVKDMKGDYFLLSYTTLEFIAMKTRGYRVELVCPSVCPA